MGDYLAGSKFKPLDTSHAAFKQSERELEESIKKLLAIPGDKAVDDIHKELGKVMWEYCGMGRSAEGLRKAMDLIPQIREQFYREVRVPGSGNDFNQELEKALRLSDFLELGELIVQDALHREESCGGHFREEHQTEENEAKRNDQDFAYVAAWEFKGVGTPATLHKEQLTFDYAKPSQRSYK
jgi:succinate dehydrogenase / fumarate reductase flavoprotein subunit